LTLEAALAPKEAEVHRHIARLGLQISWLAAEPQMHNKQMKGATAKMMDHERQDRDLQKVFEATQTSYRAAVENAFALQERTLEFARNVMEASAEVLEAQADNNRATLETLAEESRNRREAMENMLTEAAKAYESVRRSPLSHHQPQSKFEEARATPEFQPGE
jgi:hypothetical protein